MKTEAELRAALASLQEHEREIQGKRGWGQNYLSALDGAIKTMRWTLGEPGAEHPFERYTH